VPTGKRYNTAVFEFGFIYNFITLFHQLNGSIKIRKKKYTNKYNTTKKKEKEVEKTRT